MTLIRLFLIALFRDHFLTNHFSFMSQLMLTIVVSLYREVLFSVVECESYLCIFFLIIDFNLQDLNTFVY